jgi:uncharacterized protein (DUF1778 family)
MEAHSNRDERIEIRISQKDKAIFKKAQKLSGDKTFNSFIVRILRSYSKQIISEDERILASKRDRDVFFDAVFSDLQPNEKLTAAANRYKSTK